MNELIAGVIKILSENGVETKTFDTSGSLGEVKRLFLVDGAVIGMIKERTGGGEDRLFWDIRWFSGLDPAAGSFEGMYEHEAGTGEDIARFIQIALTKSIPGERERRRDTMKKRIMEESEDSL